MDIKELFKKCLEHKAKTQGLGVQVVGANNNKYHIPKALSKLRRKIAKQSRKANRS